MYAFPLTLKFKRISLSAQITVIDADGNTVLYAKQKLLKMKEEIKVYNAPSKEEHLYTIEADRIIDFSAKYSFTDLYDNDLGSVKRKGRKSLFKAHYDIFRDGDVAMMIQEDNAWVKVIDALFSEIPVIGLLSGMFFNPTYSVLRASDETKVVSIKKKPAMLESLFIIDEVEDISDAAEIDVILSILMMVLLERSRG